MHPASREQALDAARDFHAEHGRLPRSRSREREKATESRPCAKTVERRWGWERLLEELNAESQPDAPFVPLGSLMEGWRTADSRTRHDLVAAFFDELDVLDGRIISVVPSKERAAEVMALLERAYAQYRPGSPGGIRPDVQSIPPIVPALRFA